MSSRYNWWPFVLNMIRDYPERRDALRDLQEQNITASLSGMPGGGGASRTTEQVALRCLPDQEMREYNAVSCAIAWTKTLPAGNDRMKLVRWNMWTHNRTLAGCSQQLHIQERTAKRWRRQFILMVACAYGLMTEEEYHEALKKDQQKGK